MLPNNHFSCLTKLWLVLYFTYCTLTITAKINISHYIRRTGAFRSVPLGFYSENEIFWGTMLAPNRSPGLLFGSDIVKTEWEWETFNKIIAMDIWCLERHYLFYWFTNIRSGQKTFSKTFYFYIKEGDRWLLSYWEIWQQRTWFGNTCCVHLCRMCKRYNETQEASQILR